MFISHSTSEDPRAAELMDALVRGLEQRNHPPGDGASHSVRIQSECAYPQGFQAVWSITLGALRERLPKAALLLDLLAFFSPDEIPVRLLTEVHGRDLAPAPTPSGAIRGSGGSCRAAAPRPRFTGREDSSARGHDPLTSG
ncbi:hypothetical protein ACFWNK_13075 [Streptomyces sp. NPDC058417]|uniref:hypothetical protein n=1 Tax=unclassified Streptomyces TaxID=2593676 RepID=UPI003649B8A0